MKETRKAEAAPAQVAQHTPGPWIFTDQLETKGQSIYTVGYTDETGERTHDIRFIPPVSDWHTAHANARLISAAPELLAALNGLEKELQAAFDDVPAGVDAWMSIARTAIAKAEGRAE